MSHLTFRLRRACSIAMAWTAHQLVVWRISPAGLALVATALALATVPLLYVHQHLLAVLSVILYRLLSMLSGWVSRALGHHGDRQRYLRPFMEMILMLSVMGGLSLYSPERLFWPAFTLIIVVFVLDLERRLAGQFQKAGEIGTTSGTIGRLVDTATGRAGRTIVLMAACYWSGAFFWSGFTFAGICLLALLWRLVANYRQLGVRSGQAVSTMSVRQTASGMI
ncbi:hypothetical protein [Kushneria pakistanensis]|nr:hypothetical protein [Kushneria pakistanensis]